MQIPEKLLLRLQKIGLDKNIYDNRVRKCILSKEEVSTERVPWFSDAYFVDDNFENKDDYFIFDSISIVPCLVLDPQKDDKILDMCAAPGTKTFILSFLTNNEAKITANDIDRFRVKRLTHNVNKFHLSVEVSNISGRKIAGEFNKILVDAPCSGEGMVNKKNKLFEHWSERRIKFLAKTQKKLIENAFRILDTNGVLVYSTCTFEPEENEAVVDFLLKKNNNAVLEDIHIKNLKHETGLTSYDNKEFSEQIKKCVRIYPQHNNTGGFFVAKIRKV